MARRRPLLLISGTVLAGLLLFIVVEMKRGLPKGDNLDERNPKSDVLTIEAALKTYFSDFDRVPSSLGHLVHGNHDLQWIGPYLESKLLVKDLDSVRYSILSSNEVLLEQLVGTNIIVHRVECGK